MNFVSIRDVLRYCNDKDTIALRLFDGIIAKITSRFSKIYSEILHESVKNTPKKVRIMYE